MPTPRRPAPIANPHAAGSPTPRPPLPPPPVRRRRGTDWAFVAGRLLILFVAVVGSAGIGAAGGLAVSFSRLPDVSTIQAYTPHETTKIFDVKGRLLANVHGEENRVVVPLRAIPRHMQQAVIATEDTDFYHHFGVNPKGITRAMLVNVAEGASVEGASTLTQQIAKNLFLDPRKSLDRKLAEAWLAIQIEHHYSKNQILEMYLNQVYWGHNAYGIEAASQNYFGKPAKNLTIAESAVLAGLLRSPEYYSPYRNPKGAKFLQGLVLQRMVLAGYLSPAQAAEAAKQPLKYPGVTSYAYKVPYFTSHVISVLTKQYGERAMLQGGMRVYTTLDLDLQQKAEIMLREGVKASGVYNIHQGALVAIEPKTGHVKALVGGVDFAQSKFNRAVQALRPPGSTFKPFVYLTALSAGYSPSTTVVDEPISLPDGYGNQYAPNNYDHRFRGELTLRQALASSVNIIAVKLAYDVGVRRVIETAHALGIKSKLGENLSLPLGTSEVTPFEMTSAYATLANDGLYVEPTCVRKILDRNGEVLEEHKPQPKRVYEAKPLRELVDMMQGVILYGTGAAANIGRPAAGKTGTTSDARDVWFSGYTPDLATVVWMGNDDNSRLSYASTGGTVCAPVWARFMRYALKDTPPHPFPDMRAEAIGKLSRAAGARTPADGAPVAEGAPGERPDALTPALAGPKPNAGRKGASRPAVPAPAAAEPFDPLAPTPVAPARTPAPRRAPAASAPRQPEAIQTARPRPKLNLSGQKGKPPKLESVVTTDETLLEPLPDTGGTP